MTVNQWLETESWLEALLQREGVRECWNKEEKYFLKGMQQLLAQKMK